MLFWTWKQDDCEEHKGYIIRINPIDQDYGKRCMKVLSTVHKRVLKGVRILQFLNTSRKYAAIMVADASN